jgi:formate dehydrogenase beta subunit
MGMKRVLRKDFIVPGCISACPAGVDVPRYIRAARDGNFDQALAVLRERLPLPTVCADACFAPCEEACAYRQFGDPIAIRAIKRAIVDKGRDRWKTKKRDFPKTGKKVVIVGAGPAGLTAAYYLLNKGHEVTVIDTFPRPGGMLRYGIPSYRLPEERLDKDIQDILSMGIRFQGNVTLGKDITLSELKEDFDAVFLATGSNASTRIPLEGSEKKGVLWGLDFLRDTALGKAPPLRGEVIVVGGGNVAIDVALTARRLGTSEIHLFSLECRDEMPAHPWEIARAEEEGVLIYNSWAPKKVLGEGSVKGLVLMKCLSVFDKTGAFNPSYDPDITYKRSGNIVILAVGQAADLGFLEKESAIVRKDGRIEVNKSDLSTGEPGVFAGGDAVSGPASIIQAIAQGREAASNIDRYLGGDGRIDEVLADPEEEVILPDFVVDVRPRNNLPLIKPWERLSGFRQLELGLTDEQIAAESSRCLSCDARQFVVTVNTENCKECGYCAEVCRVNAFGPADFFNEKGYRPYEVKSSDWCVGCSKCYFACPDFAIDVKEGSV